MTAIRAVGSVRKRESAKSDTIKGTLADGIGLEIKGVCCGSVKHLQESLSNVSK